MKKILILLALICVVGIAIHGCGKKMSADDKLLAKVSNKFITLGEFKGRISKLPSYYRGVVSRNKKKFLDETIVEMMFYEEAIRDGLDRDKEVREVINEAKKKILIAKLIKNQVEDKVKIEDAEARQFYENRKEDFKTPQMWRASHILVPTESEAEDIRSLILKGTKFEELARERSTDATATRGGDVGYFRQGQLVPDFENTATKLKIGEMSGIVHTQFGYHIIKLTDKKDPAIEPYEKVKRKIEDELKRRKRSELFDQLVLDLKNKYNVQIEDDVLKSLEALDKGEKAARK